MDLQAYLQRIGFSGKARVDLQTLRAIHRRHLLSVPYENIDVQLEVSGGTSVESAFEKIVLRERGGWCYEMNGLLAWALSEIGFSVTRVSAGVARSTQGDAVMGNHLVLLIELNNQLWIVDTGFGDGLFEPVQLTPQTFEQRGFAFGLSRTGDGYWRLLNHRFGGAPSFDFLNQPADEDELDDQCYHLQTDDNSPFVLALVCQQFVEQGYETQLGRVARTITPAGVESRLINSADELIDRLKTTFRLDVPEVARLWPRIVDRHNKVFTKKKKRT